MVRPDGQTSGDDRNGIAVVRAVYLKPPAASQPGVFSIIRIRDAQKALVGSYLSPPTISPNSTQRYVFLKPRCLSFYEEYVHF